MIRPGESYYRVSASQHNTELIPIGSARRRTDIDGKPRASIEHELGILDQFAFASRFSTIPLRDGRQRLFASGGVRNSFNRAYSAVDLTIGTGLALQGAIQTRLKNLNVAARSTQLFYDFESEQFPARNHQTRNQSRIRFNGMLPGQEHVRIPFSITLQNDYFSDLGNRTRLSNRLSTRARGINFIHNANLHRQPTGDYFYNGSLVARRRTRILSPEAQFAYSADQGLRRYEVGSRWRINGDTQAQASVTHNVRTPQDVIFRTGINQQLNRFSWGANFGASARGRLSVGATITSSFGYDPRTERWEPDSHSLTTAGAVVPRVFWDKSHDGVFNEEVDEPIDEARFIVNRSRRRDHETDEQGLAVLPNMPSNDFVDIKLERRSLYDPFFVPTPEGHSVVPRPGAPTYIDFPVVMTGEVDGTVQMKRHGVAQPVPNVVIELVNADGDIVQEAASAFDGFFLLDFIVPGQYTVRISPEQLQGRNMEGSDEIEIEIGVDGTIVSGQNFELRRLSTE